MRKHFLISGLFIQWVIGPAEDETEKWFQFVGITASVVSITKVDFISIRKLSSQEQIYEIEFSLGMQRLVGENKPKDGQKGARLA